MFLWRPYSGVAILYFSLRSVQRLFSFFFLNDPATTEISPLPLHDALPIGGTRVNSESGPATSHSARAVSPDTVACEENRPRSPSNLVARSCSRATLSRALRLQDLATRFEIGRAHV